MNINPDIKGYFVLADVCCRDESLELSQATIQYMRANNDAALKELKASSVFSWCYLMDYNPHYGSLSGHLDALGDFVYINTITNYFDMRLSPLNPIADETNRYAKFGLSKLVHPVDDLFDYFARQSVIDDISNIWCRIDKDIQARVAHFKKNCLEGIPDAPLDVRRAYMSFLDGYGRGAMSFLFRQIYDSTQVLDENGMPVRSKAVDYVNEVRRYVESVVNNNSQLQKSYELCSAPMPDEFENHDNGDIDILLARRREQDLEDFKKVAMGFIGRVKDSIIHDCFLADSGQVGSVSPHLEFQKHHLNTYILEKDNEMHPLAVRYFLYDIKLAIDEVIDGLKKDNKDLLDEVNSYQYAFDDPQTPSIVEGAVDSLKGASDNMNFFQRLFGGRPYKDAKEAYASKSTNQAKKIHKYVNSKLLEEVYEGLSCHLSQLIEEFESFFNHLPKAVEKLAGYCESSLCYHDDSPNKKFVFVLASKKLKKGIYDSVISRNAPTFVSSKISASVYRNLYNDAVLKIGGRTGMNGWIVERTIEGFMWQYVDFQDRVLRKDNPEYAEMNVMEALMKESMWECDGDTDRADYLEKKLFGVDRLAGADERIVCGEGYSDDVWFGHPGCIDVLQRYHENLLQVGHVSDKCLSRNEIVRVATASLLKLDKDFNFRDHLE